LIVPILHHWNEEVGVDNQLAASLNKKNMKRKYNKIRSLKGWIFDGLETGKAWRVNAGSQGMVPLLGKAGAKPLLNT
jgi:hypothetical protein